MEVGTRSGPSAVQGMLWDKSDVTPVRLVARRRGVAIALTTCRDLTDRIRSALDLACFDVISIESLSKCIAAIATEKPDIILLDARWSANLVALQTTIAQARVTESLPVLPISPDSAQTEIFLKTRAVLRHERPGALRGQRQSGSLLLDEPRFKLSLAEKSVDLSKPDLCLLGPFFDLEDAVWDRQSIERLLFDGAHRKAGSRIVDFQISRMRRRVKACIGVDPLRSVRGVGYALAKV